MEFPKEHQFKKTFFKKMKGSINLLKTKKRFLDQKIRNNFTSHLNYNKKVLLSHLPEKMVNQVRLNKRANPNIETFLKEYCTSKSDSHKRMFAESTNAYEL
mmetsp:Transcript_4946/g.4192  ORF Transcript_4946/g.4192 Transcript_4946/m.4192 type:complete len:101 (+) Transcript_4946:131-433(+)